MTKSYLSSKSEFMAQYHLPLVSCSALLRLHAAAENKIQWPLMRLIQSKPSWYLHVLLRAYKINYTCQNIDSDSALGHTAPFVCASSSILSHEEFLEYILNLSFSTESADGKETPGESSIGKKYETLRDIKYLKYSLCDVLHEIQSLSGQTKQAQAAFHSLNLTYLFDFQQHLKSLIPPCEPLGVTNSLEKLLAQLAQEHEYLDALLRDNEGSLFADDGPGESLNELETLWLQHNFEAILFEHLVFAQTVPAISQSFKSTYPHLNVFFETVLNALFGDAAIDTEHHRKSTMMTIHSASTSFLQPPLTAGRIIQPGVDSFDFDFDATAMVEEDEEGRRTESQVSGYATDDKFQYILLYPFCRIITAK